MPLPSTLELRNKNAVESAALFDNLTKNSMFTKNGRWDDRKSTANKRGAIQLSRTLEPWAAWRFPMWKRAADLVGAVLALILLSPALLLIAALIKLVSPGPIFFKQIRVGHRGKHFEIFKFRTMHVNADTTVHQSYLGALMQEEKPMKKLDLKDDARIIPFGKILRQTAIDELPQLINILRGEMSIVGPRPCLPYEADKYLLWHCRRFDVRPGLTGLWQVSGKNKTTFSQMIRFDISYARKISLWLDLKIIFKTIPAIIDQVMDGREKTKLQGVTL